MKLWRRTLNAFIVILLSAGLGLMAPQRSQAAPQGRPDARVFLPLLLNYAPATITITVGPIFENNELFVYEPVTATIHAGDTVHWVWESDGHTVTSGTAPAADDQFCSPDNTDCAGEHISDTGAVFDHQFLAPGTYDYFCQIHWSIGMTGTVIVLP